MLNVVLLLLLILSALWAVMASRLIKAVIALATVSVLLSILMYRLGSPLAAVFELSVCAGLIPVFFVTTVSFTKRMTPENIAIRRHTRWKKYSLLFILLMLFSVWLLMVKLPIHFQPGAPEAAVHGEGVRELLWNLRRWELLGQIVILIAGIYGVVVFFKERRNV